MYLFLAYPPSIVPNTASVMSQHIRHRYADTQGLGLAAAGVVVDSKSGKIPCMNERTNVPHIYAIGDVVMDAPGIIPCTFY